MSRLGVVVGLPQEAAILKRVLGTSAPLIRCAGSQPTRAAAGARELIGEGVQILLSFGLAGGLDPRLRPGDIVVAGCVTAPDGTVYPSDASLRDRLCQALQVAAHRCAGSGRILASTEEKQALAARTGAVAVDMESHALAATGFPFAVLRVIVDPADRAIPGCVLDALDERGRVRPLALLNALLRRPADIPALAALGRDHAVARKGLRRAAAALGQIAQA